MLPSRGTHRTKDGLKEPDSYTRGDLFLARAPGPPSVSDQPKLWRVSPLTIANYPGAASLKVSNWVAERTRLDGDTRDALDVVAKNNTITARRAWSSSHHESLFPRGSQFRQLSRRGEAKV